MRKRKIADTVPAARRATRTETPTILAPSKELDTGGISKDETAAGRTDSGRRIYRTPSESFSECARSTASRSRAAMVIKQPQLQPRPHWAESTSRGSAVTRKTLSEQHRGIRHLERVSEEQEQTEGRRDSAESESRFRTDAAVFQTGEAVIGEAQRATTVFPQMMHQQTTSEEKFFKKNDRQRGLVEEGYDRAEVTYTTPASRYSHSEVV
ncbi:unnamed protein product [Gongylonema pulchrum]|uniref:Uncharacterized protein n=1 Tax=Gongylonema pulchrum TaxID=637853 RepID=A0A183CUU1_9BILA|nr:unnamed protein product [Gongylonema pulchrum]